MIRFLLNRDLVELELDTADITVLDWLRLQQSLTGTKEGCGSGDCGACTVVLVSPSDTPNGLPLKYTSANSCILPMGAVHGHQLITVEHLGSSTDLHPVQQAMVDHHGSQCGFCTPGFVMSLFALFHQRLEAEVVLAQDDLRHALIEQYLGGNLCRCTGYRPIIAAAESILNARLKGAVTDGFDANEKTMAKVLSAIQGGAASTDQTTIHIPDSLVDALSLWKSVPDARVVAGGTDAGLELTQSLSQWSSVIHLSQLTSLKDIHRTDSGLVLGAGVTIAALLDQMALDFPDAVPMLLRFGSEQVRSQATIGGNLGTASPIGDLPPLLLALGADIELVSLDESGQQLQTRQLALSDYFLDYRKTQRADNEWIHRVSIPYLGAGDVLRVYKISKRLDDDISSVCAAIWIQTRDSSNGTVIEDLRLAFGGMAAIPKRAEATETELRGAILNQASIEAGISTLSQDFSPIDDARASADYRMQVAGNLLQRLLNEISNPDQLSDIGQVGSIIEHTA